MQLTSDSRQIPKEKELVIIDGQVEKVLTAETEMKLESGDRKLTVSLRPLPKVNQLLQNYSNPFNPETWIPFKLTQDSTVTAKIYDLTGKQIRIIELGHLELCRIQ